MRARRTLAATVAAVALGAGIIAVGPGGVANAMCPRNVDCTPDPVDPDITPTPRPRPTGDFTSFSALPDFCEPRATPWYTIRYTVPGSVRSEVYHNGWSTSGPFELVGTYYATSVTVRHEGHGRYTVKSYGPGGQVYTRSDFRC